MLTVLHKNLHVFSVNPAYRMPGGGRRGGGGRGATGDMRNVGMNPPMALYLITIWQTL
jgi:hypothetical protein